MSNVRTCRVCGCDDLHACEGGCCWLSPTDDLCSACAPAAAHVVSMTLDNSPGKNVRHVATCKCGWTENAIRTTGGKMVLNKRIRRHWQDAVRSGAGAGAATSPLPNN